MQKEMCVKCNLPFQEELYVDIGCSLEGAPVAVAKNKMAALLKTSRTQVDRLLDPKSDITLASL